MVFSKKFNPISKVLEVGKAIDVGKTTNIDLLTTPIKDVENLSLNPGKKYYYSKLQNTYGLKGKPVQIAYCGIQSLMAIATDYGEIHIYGQKQIDVKIDIDRESITEYMCFVKGLYLVVITANNRVTVISLKTKGFLHVKTIPFNITCIEYDPTLVWLLLGLEDGTVMMYNVETNFISNYVINDLQKLHFFYGKRHSEVVHLQWNPRDLGTLLISYRYVTILYSIFENKIKTSFIYELEPYAPGGDFSTNINKKRTPRVIQSLFHPNSLFVLTIHEDNSLVFWDSNTGKLIEARTLFSNEINIPDRSNIKPLSSDLPHILKAKWLCQNNTEYTTLFIVNGPSEFDPSVQSVVMIEFGKTPLYSLNTYESVSTYFTEVKQQKLLPISNNSKIKGIVPVGTQTPFFNRSHNPKLIILLLENGEIEGITFPTTNLIYNGPLFPRGVSLIWPKICIIEGVPMDKELWTQMNAIIQPNKGLLYGGSLIRKMTQMNEDEPTVLISGHSNGMVRIWNSIHKDYDESAAFEIDVASILNTSTRKGVSRLSFSPETLMFSVSLATGSTVICKFEANEYYNSNSKNKNQERETKSKRFSLSNFDSFVVDVKDRAPTQVKYGFMPQYTINYRGNVTALCQSAIKITVVAYQDGTLFVLDYNNDKSLETIYCGNISELKVTKSGYITAVDLSVQQFGSDKYSSILLTCGTDIGELIYFKILPSTGCSYRVQFTNIIEAVCFEPIKEIHSYELTSLKSCKANLNSLQKMEDSEIVKGHLVVVSKKEFCDLKPGNPNVNRIHKTILGEIISSKICYHQNHVTGHYEKFLTLMTQVKNIVCFSIPDFNNKIDITIPFQIEKIKYCSILSTGYVIFKDDSYHSSLVNIFNGKKDVNGVPESEKDELELYDPDCEILSRPQVNSLQRIRGTSYVDESNINDKFLFGSHNEKHESKAFRNVQQSNQNVVGTLFSNVQQTNQCIKDQICESVQQTNANCQSNDKTSNYNIVSNKRETTVPHSRKNFFAKVVTRVNRKLDDAQDKMDDWTMSIGTTMNDAMQDNSRGLFK